MTEYVNLWKNYFNFAGNASRRDYWLAILLNSVIWIAVEILANVTQSDILIVLSYAYVILAAIPCLSIAVRRLRDAGKLWTNLLWFFCPLVGPIIVIVMLAKATAAK